MEPDNILLVTVLAALLIMMIAGVFVVKDEYLSKRQKLFLLILIFTLPFLGALVVWSISGSMKDDNVTRNEVSGSQPHKNTTVTPTQSGGGISD